MTGWRGKTLLAGLVAIYAGLFLGGMSLPFAVAMPGGLAILLLYTVLMRPVAQWGGSGAVGAVRFGLALAVLGALSALLAGAGQGAALLVGAPWPWLGPCVALGGVGVSRAVWSAGKSADMDAFLEDAIAAIEGKAREFRDESLDTPHARTMDDLPEMMRETIRSALGRLAELTTRSDRVADAAAMAEIVESLEDKYIWEVALDELAANRVDPATAEAHVRLAIRPYVAMKAFGSGASLAVARDALASGSGRLALALAEEAHATLAVMPDFWRELPPAAELRAAAASGEMAAASTALRDLAARVDALASEDPDAAEAAGT